VPNARIVLSEGNELSSDRDGRFRVPGLEDDGFVRIGVRKDGYLPWEGALDALCPTEQQVTLLRGTPLTVIVLAPDRTPVAGARVQVVRREEKGIAGMWWSTRLVDLVEGTSDPEGRVALGAAPEGRLEIRVDDPRYPRARKEIDVGGVDPVRCEVILSDGGTVSGRVLDRGGYPVGGARVHAGSTPGRTAVTREDGTYDLHFVVEGESRIFAEAADVGTGFFGASFGWGHPVPVRVAPGRTVSGVDIVLSEAVHAEGRVVDVDGRPLGGVRVQGIAEPALSHMCLTPLHAATDGEGRFTIGPFRHVADGRIRLSFAMVGFAIDPVCSQAGGGPGTVRMGDVVAHACGGVSGTVLDAEGRPLRRGRVRLLSGRNAVLVGPNGAFVLDRLPPGRAWVQAEAWGPLRRSDALAVEIEAGAVSTGLVIRLEPTGSIRGRVAGSDGDARPGVTVAAIPDRGTPPPDGLLPRATTDAQGAFDLAGLPEGSYRVGILRVPFEEETAVVDGRLAYAEDAVAVRMFVPGLDEYALPIEEGGLLAEPEPMAARTGGDDVVLVVPVRGTIIEGRVVSGATGRPLRSFDVSFVHYWRGLIPQGSETLEIRDDRGRFAHELRSERFWAAEFSAPGHAAVRTPVRCCGAGGAWNVGTVRLGQGGRLHGTIHDAQGDAVCYARVYLLGPALQTHKRPIFTDSEGRYEADGVAPGTYTMFVLSPRHPFGIARDIEIQEKGASRQDVRLGRASPVTLIVLDDAGQPVPGADVSYTCDALLPLTSKLLRSHEPPGWGGYRTNGQGRLFKPFLPAARVLFRVRAEGFRIAARAADLREDQETVIEIRLEGVR
jgi:protocatechuate 3,4-dioxygenase beta subunit